MKNKTKLLFFKLTHENVCVMLQGLQKGVETIPSTNGKKSVHVVTTYINI